jgi:hypothetical protein
MNIERIKFQPNFYFTWLVIFIFSCGRAAEIIKFPSFWAEDGTYFFKDALELGFASIYTPIVGHYHTIPRILAYFGTFFPVAQMPLFIIITAGLVSSACLAYFVRDGFEWIIKSRWMRFGGALLISLLPGSEEVLFAYCDMNYVFFAFITLFFLENYQGSKSRLLIRELFFSSIWFSAGQGIVFLPVLLFEVWKRNWLRLISLTTLVISVFINSQASHNVSNNKFNLSTFKVEQIFDLALVYIDNVFMRYIHRPLLYEKIIKWLNLQYDFVFYSASVLLAFLCVSVLVKSKILANQVHLRNKFFVLMAATPLIFPLIALVRRYNIVQGFRHELNFSGRYAFQAFLLASLFILLTLKSIETPKLWQKFGLRIMSLFIFINIFHYDLRFSSDRIKDFEIAWPTQAAAIEAALDKVRVKKISSEETVLGPIRCRPSWWQDSIGDIVIKPL